MTSTHKTTSSAVLMIRNLWNGGSYSMFSLTIRSQTIHSFSSSFIRIWNMRQLIMASTFRMKWFLKKRIEKEFERKRNWFWRWNEWSSSAAPVARFEGKRRAKKRGKGNWVIHLTSVVIVSALNWCLLYINHLGTGCYICKYNEIQRKRVKRERTVRSL